MTRRRSTISSSFAGAPDRSGWRYPAEEAMARFVAKQPELVVRTSFIERVAIHSWFGHLILELEVDRTNE